MTIVTKNITLPKALVKKKEGVVILPLEEYERIKEDLEMLQSKKLAKEIEKARKEKKTISLEKILKENNL
ncbi:MAG: hypothetical protein AAB890_00570 [Patescibacteria group bacterium]